MESTKKEKLYYIAELEEIRDEKGLRKLLLQNEVAHIAENLNDYIDGYNSIATQCDIISNCVNLSIEDIIDNLINYWSYSIFTVERKTYITTIVFKLNVTIGQLQELINRIQKDFSMEFIQIKNQGLRYMKGSPIAEHYFLSIEHVMHNVDEEKFNNFLDSQTIIYEWN